MQQFTVNLNDKAKAGKVDPLIGRMPKVDRTVQILCRRSKNNPLYVGDPGVGKTAIAEGLARKIIEGDVPDVLKEAVIYALDMGALLAGTRYRGDFEPRLKSVVTVLEKMRHAVLYHQGIRTANGAGTARGKAHQGRKPRLMRNQWIPITVTTTPPAPVRSRATVPATPAATSGTTAAQNSAT